MIKKDAKEGCDLFRAKIKHSNKKLKLTLPLPPSINHMYVNTKFGGKRLSNSAEDYVRVARAKINLFVEEQSYKKQNKETWQYIDLVFFMPDRRIRDSHNMIKLLLDVLQGPVYENDYWIMPRVQGVEYDKENARIECLLVPQTPIERAKGLKIAGIGENGPSGSSVKA